MKNKLKLLILIVMIFNIFTSISKADNPLDTNWRDYFSQYCIGLSQPVLDITIENSKLFICGQFDSDWCANSLNGLGIWNDTTWIGIGGDTNTIGVNGYPQTILVKGDTLLTGGLIIKVDTFDVNGLAGWNYNSTTPLTFGEGVYTCYSSGTFSKRIGVIRDMVFWGDSVIVGGVFDSAGTSKVHNIAMWDGSNWNSIGTGIGGEIRTLELDGNKLYVGGKFNYVFDNSSTYTMNNVGCFDLSSKTWTSIGEGVNGEINDIHIFNDNIYLAGEFNKAYTSSSTFTMNNVAMWNGNQWDSLDGGTNGIVYSIEDDSIGVYIGGNFTTAGDVQANHIAYFANSYWKALGTGTDGPVIAMEYYNNSLYIGGAFWETGGKESHYIGLWSSQPPVPPKNIPSDAITNEYNELKNNIEIYPNPSNGILNTNFELEQNSNITLELFNLTGQRLFILIDNKEYSSGKYSYKYDLSYLYSGPYLLKFKSGNKIITKLFIILN